MIKLLELHYQNCLMRNSKIAYEKCQIEPGEIVTSFSFNILGYSPLYYGVSRYYSPIHNGYVEGILSSHDEEECFNAFFYSVKNTSFFHNVHDHFSKMFLKQCSPSEALSSKLSRCRKKFEEIIEKAFRKKISQETTLDDKKAFCIFVYSFFSWYSLPYETRRLSGTTEFLPSLKNYIRNVTSDFESYVPKIELVKKESDKLFSIKGFSDNPIHYSRNAGLRDIKSSVIIKQVGNFIITNSTIFHKKDDKIKILACAYLDESFYDADKNSFKFETFLDFILFHSKSVVPKKYIKYFFDRDSFISPTDEEKILIKNLQKNIPKEAEVFLINGYEEFSKNFKIAKIKTFKTLKEKQDFSNKILKDLCDKLPDVDTSIFSLEKVKKIVDEYNEALSIKEEPVIPVSQPVVEETPDNLQELMEFAALMNFEPEEPSVSRSEPEDEEDDDDDTLFERAIEEEPVGYSGQGLISQITSQEEVRNISPNILQQMIGVDPATNNVAITGTGGELQRLLQDFPEIVTIDTSQDVQNLYELHQQLSNNTNG